MTSSSLTAPVARPALRRAERLGAILLALTVAGWPLPSLAQAPVPEDETPRYTVELIVFVYRDDSTAGNEIFAPAPGGEQSDPYGSEAEQAGQEPVFDDRSLPFPDPDSDDAGERATGLPGPSAGPAIELQRLEPEAFTMTDAIRKLEQLDAYRPILHTAWTQTTHDRAESPTLPLRALGDPPPGLDGSITLYQSRFLHLDVDLSLAAGRPDSATAGSATDRLIRGGDARQQPPANAGDPAESTLFTPPVRYRISEDRIMRDGDIRYFDHPRFGMLARVTRLTPEKAAAGERRPLEPGDHQ